MNNDQIKISMKEFEKYRSVMDSDTHSKIYKAIFGGDNFVTISKTKYEELKNGLKKNLKYENTNF